MKKLNLTYLFLFAFASLFAQSTLTVGSGGAGDPPTNTGGGNIDLSNYVTSTNLSNTLDDYVHVDSLDLNEIDTIVFHVAGQYLLDPGEVNGYGAQGYVDNIFTQDLGNWNATNLNRLSGGISFPFDVKLVGFAGSHRNSSGNAQGWGWVIAKQQKTINSNTVTTEWILDEAFSRDGEPTNLRNYGSTVNQKTNLDLSNKPNNIIPAGETIIFAVSAPTAATTNYYVQLYGGYLMFEKL